MTESEKYNVNFFKPLSDHAKANKKLIIILAVIWAVGVFGFQILLMLLNEPTPEKSYEVFQNSMPAMMENEDSTNTGKAELARTFLHVLGKNIAVKENHKTVLKTALSKIVFSMAADSINAVFKSDVSDESVILAKQMIGLGDSGFDKIMADLIPSSLVKVEDGVISEECKKAIPEIMQLYLVHNQNALTDFNFLGFPFHYWYTAQFLLIMFVILCLVYAMVNDKSNEKYDFVEET